MTKYGNQIPDDHDWEASTEDDVAWRERTSAEIDMEVTLHDEGYQTDRRWTVHVREGHRDHPVAIYAAEHQNKGNFWRDPELWRDAVDFVELPQAVQKRVASMLNQSVDDVRPEERLIHREDGTGVGDQAPRNYEQCEVCGGRVYDGGARHDDCVEDPA